MLSLALAATLVGFVLLIVGLITGTVWLAVACIVVCLIGLGFLIVDIVGSGRRDESVLDEEFDGRGDQDDDRSAGPVSDRDGDADADLRGPPPPSVQREPDAPPATRRESPPQSSWQGVIQPRGGVSGSEDSAETETAAVREAGAHPAGGQANSPREGNYDDYLRSVGGDPATGGFRRPQAPGQSGQGHPAPPTNPAGPGTAHSPQQYPVRGEPAGQQRPGRGPLPDAGPDQSTPRQQPSTPQSGPSDERQPSDRQWGQPDRETGTPTARFDPLDPNWRPPLD